jgi:hypothetical protein
MSLILRFFLSMSKVITVVRNRILTVPKVKTGCTIPYTGMLTRLKERTLERILTARDTSHHVTFPTNQHWLTAMHLFPRCHAYYQFPLPQARFLIDLQPGCQYRHVTARAPRVCVAAFGPCIASDSSTFDIQAQLSIMRAS